jgi:hypothetical protein
MRTSPLRPRPALARRLAAIAALGACLLSPMSPSQAAEWESEAHNVVVTIPGAPAPWEWVTPQPEWREAGIIKGARRILATLKGGQPAAGEGGVVYVMRKPAPAGKTLAEVAASDEVRAPFLRRFGGTQAEVASETTHVLSREERRHPAVVLRTEGTAPNLRATAGPCAGLLVVTVARGHLYLLRAYVFHTASDAEGLRQDLVWLEADGLELLRTRPDAPPKPPEEDDGAKEPGPERKAEVIEDRARMWRVTKHAKLDRAEISETERGQDLALKLEGADTLGGYQLYLYVTPPGRKVNGQVVPAPDLTNWMTHAWWQDFTATHPKGDLVSWRFPRKPTSDARTWLTLPRLEDEENRFTVVAKDGKRPVVVDANDALKKLRYAARPRNKLVGARTKVSEAMRGCLAGNHPLHGSHLVCRYAWRYRGCSYRLFVALTGRAYLKYGEALRATLESLAIGNR